MFEKKVQPIITLSQQARTETLSALQAAKRGDDVTVQSTLNSAQETLAKAEMQAVQVLQKKGQKLPAMDAFFLEEHLQSTATTLLLTTELITLMLHRERVSSRRLRIMLICASGMSSGMLMKKMNEWAAEHQQAIYVQSFGIGEYLKFIDEYDIILVGPQMNHHVKTIASQIDKPVSAIPPLDFAVGNIDNIMKMIDELLTR